MYSSLRSLPSCTQNPHRKTSYLESTHEPISTPQCHDNDTDKPIDVAKPSYSDRLIVSCDNQLIHSGHSKKTVGPLSYFGLPVGATLSAEILLLREVPVLSGL